MDRRQEDETILNPMVAIIVTIIIIIIIIIITLKNLNKNVIFLFI
jgi:hypothetical protein